ncbi:uncharacterized protein LOC124193574 [Daphnia pulex]|uniref:uncharacterized protein LOC124193574 n=1 Tax=Daphnia pulex TaxID=6669 RepID=UPI001EDFCB95|nr:uncharacterized protein LOC124193574 [Daphnia pulex]
MLLLLVVTQLMASGLVLNNHQLKIGMILITNNNPKHFGQQNLVPAAHRDIESLLFTHGAAFSEFEWEAGLLLMLRQRYFLTYEALLFVSQSIHEHYSRNMAIVQEKLAALFISTEGTGSTEFKAAFL